VRGEEKSNLDSCGEKACLGMKKEEIMAQNTGEFISSMEMEGGGKRGKKRKESSPPQQQRSRGNSLLTSPRGKKSVPRRPFDHRSCGFTAGGGEEKRRKGGNPRRIKIEIGKKLDNSAVSGGRFTSCENEGEREKAPSRGPGIERS